MRPSNDTALPHVGGAVESARRGSRWRRWLLILPVAAFVGLAVAFSLGLHRDPRLVPSPLVGKAVPDFTLPPVQGHQLGLSSGDLNGEVSLVNVFASWCLECRDEHPLLMELSRQRLVPVHGINYKDKPADAAHWLDTMGDPYVRTGADLDGRVAIDWGVYGVPETFVVDAEGRIAMKRVGALTPAILEVTILPLVAKLRAEAPRPTASNKP